MLKEINELMNLGRFLNILRQLRDGLGECRNNRKINSDDQIPRHFRLKWTGKTKKLKLLHWNARSLEKKAKQLEFRNFAKYHDFDIIIVSETWYGADAKLLAISGYKVSSKPPGLSKGGDLAGYYKKH